MCLIFGYCCKFSLIEKEDRSYKRVRALIRFKLREFSEYAAT